MNVLLVGDGDTKYGAPHSLCQLAIELSKKDNVTVSVIVNKDSLIAKQMRDAGCTVYIIRYEAFYQGIPYETWKYPIKYIIMGILYWYSNKRIIPETKMIFEKNQFDIIHANSSREDIGAILAKNYRVPLVWHIREFGDIDYKCYSYRKGYISFMNESADAFVTVSEAVRKHWVSKGIDEEKIKTVYNGVQVDTVPDMNKEKTNTCALVILGSVIPTKGQIQAVEAVINLNKLQNEINYTLDIIGGCNRKYTSEIKKIIKANSADGQIRFLGYKDNADEYLADYSIGLMCSKNEAFGRVTAEYMMWGLAVVASDTGANKELIRDGIDGLLYQYGNVEDLSQKIQKVFLNLKEFGGNNTRKYAIENYSSNVNANRIYQLYMNTVQKIKREE